MNQDTPKRGWLRMHGITLIVLVALFVGSILVVKHFKKPGQMTVIESQAMDMSAMKPPLGSVPVATEIARRAPFSSTVKYTGSIAPLNEQNIYPRVEGWITGLKVYNGDRVKAGQLLAVIDSPDIGSRAAEASFGRSAARTEIPVAQANLARMRAERNAAAKESLAAGQDRSAAEAQASAAEKLVVQAQKELKSAQAALVYRQAEFKRTSNLLKQGAMSQEEYDSELANVTSAEADVESKQAKVEESDANLKAAQAGLKNKMFAVEAALERVSAADATINAGSGEVSQKRANARTADAVKATADSINQYRFVRAPFDGIVTKRYLSPGVMVTTGQAILNIAQMDRVRLQANVSDADVRLLSVGTKVTARFPKDPSRTVIATISSLSPQSDQASRTAVAEAIVDNPGMSLHPGDFVVMQITTSFSEGAITVPSSAVVSRDGRSAVWLAKGTKPTGAVLYTCTMHPEVIRDKPGLCPKCGMKLVPKVSSTGKTSALAFVTLGNSNGDRTQVISGINEGDEVIYQGNAYLKDGQAVSPVKWGDNGPSELPAAAGGGMENMPGMGGGKGAESMPGMDMPGKGAESMPGMDMSGKGAESMPGMDMSGKGAKSMPGMTMPSSSGTGSVASKTKTRSAPAGKPAKAVKQYTCSMHPEFVTTDPNAVCPKCGMKVIEKTGKR